MKKVLLLAVIFLVNACSQGIHIGPKISPSIMPTETKGLLTPSPNMTPPEKEYIEL